MTSQNHDPNSPPTSQTILDNDVDMIDSPVQSPETIIAPPSTMAPGKKAKPNPPEGEMAPPLHTRTTAASGSREAAAAKYAALSDAEKRKTCQLEFEAPGARWDTPAWDAEVKAREKSIVYFNDWKSTKYPDPFSWAEKAEKAEQKKKNKK